jgi:hypothetical protein
MRRSWPFGSSLGGLNGIQQLAQFQERLKRDERRRHWLLNYAMVMPWSILKGPSLMRADVSPST